VVVLNNPNNPTGRYHPRETVAAVADLAADAGAYLLCDEVYRLLADDPLDPAAAASHGISTTGLSKAWGLAGLRFGWLAGPPAVANAVRNWKDYTTISPPRIAQHVARQALDREDEIIAENRALVRENRAHVASFLDDHGLGWSDPVGVNALIEVPGGFDGGEAFCRRVVREESVVLAPGECFDVPGHFRLGFGLETDALREGLARLDAFLARHA
jgi:aspartate/methionine/tyrosine aminotransferase